MSGGIDLSRRWPLSHAWRVAAEVTAQAYGIAPALIMAQSRGRGPRPPAHVWEPKKMALHLTVLLSGCAYAELAREVGLNKDTVCSHCAEVRDKLLMDDVTEATARTIEQIARLKLGAECRERLDAARAHLGLMTETVAELMGLSVHPTPHPTLHPTPSERSRNRDQNAGTKDEAA